MMKKLAVILILVGGLYFAFKNTKNVLTKHLTLSTKLNHKKIPEHLVIVLGNFFMLYLNISNIIFALSVFSILPLNDSDLGP